MVLCAPRVVLVCVAQCEGLHMRSEAARTTRLFALTTNLAFSVWVEN